MTSKPRDCRTGSRLRPTKPRAPVNSTLSFVVSAGIELPSCSPLEPGLDPVQQWCSRTRRYDSCDVVSRCPAARSTVAQSRHCRSETDNALGAHRSPRLRAAELALHDSPTLLRRQRETGASLGWDEGELLDGMDLEASVERDGPQPAWGLASSRRQSRMGERLYRRPGERWRTSARPGADPAQLNGCYHECTHSSVTVS